MKKIFIYAILSMLIMPIMVKAVAIGNLVLTGDERVAIGGQISLPIVAGGELSLSPDTLFFYVKYDKNIFDFVSYEGIGNTLFNENEQYVYVKQDSSITMANIGDTVGTLTLKVKSTLTNESSTAINYYTEYESVSGEGTKTITYYPNTNVNTNSVEDSLMGIIYVYLIATVTGGVLAITAIIVLLRRKFKKH